jgi:hypothetical protein
MFRCDTLSLSGIFYGQTRGALAGKTECQMLSLPPAFPPPGRWMLAGRDPISHFLQVLDLAPLDGLSSGSP